MDNNSDIIIACAVDNPYAMMATTMIKSIQHNHQGNEIVHVYLIDNGLTKRSKRKLLSSVKSSIIKIIWLRVNDYTLRLLSIDNYFQALSTHYYRLLIPYLIPEKFSKVIYLDCDLLAMVDIKELWKEKFDGNVICAVQDSRVRMVSCRCGGIKNYQELGLDAETKFFNSGVLLIDLKKWREKRISEKVLRCNEDNKDHVIWDNKETNGEDAHLNEQNKKFVKYRDQYGLNVVLSNMWKELDPRWNQFPEAADFNTFILHYAGRNPIDQDYDGKYKELFLKYLDMTIWRLYEQGPLIRVAKKIISTLPFFD